MLILAFLLGCLAGPVGVLAWRKARREYDFWRHGEVWQSRNYDPEKGTGFSVNRRTGRATFYAPTITLSEKDG